MQHSWWRGPALWLLFVVLAQIATPGCSSGTPEQAVRRQLQDLQAAIDDRNAGDVQAVLADDFVGNQGMDRRGAHQLAVAVFLRHRDVGARIGPVTIALRGEDQATATFSVLATGGNGGFFPDSGQVFEVETGWRLVEGEWRLLNARWSPAL